MNWLAFFLQLVPVALQAIETISTDLKDHEKAQAVKDALASAAQGVAIATPQHAQAAQVAAAAATSIVDSAQQVYQAVSGSGSTTPAGSGSTTPAAPSLSTLQSIAAQ